jgi:hypothetical protein
MKNLRDIFIEEKFPTFLVISPSIIQGISINVDFYKNIYGYYLCHTIDP